MKLMCAFMFVAVMQVSATSYAQKINIAFKNANLEDVFIRLKQESGYNFLYNAQLLESAKPVTLSLKQATINQVMNNLMANQPLTYTINQKTITIQPRLQQPDIPVRGRITDEQGEALPGVNIKVKGTAVGAISAADGTYTLKVPDTKSILVFSFLGFVSQEIPVAGHTTINVMLKQQNTDLSEVVVTALGIKREEKALGYSATQVTGEQLTDALSNNWTEALSGKVAGLNLIRSGAGPNGSNKIILRGENNLTGDNEALIVVDGVVINNGSGRMTGSGNNAYLDEDSPVDFGTNLNDINPDDIESVNVLKGPGAAALYGQRGANGAIIITTKSGKPRIKGIGVTVNSNSSFETISRWPDYQYEYGSGTEGVNYFSWGNTADGPSTRSSSAAWGPKFNGQMYFQYDPVTHKGATVRTPWVAYPDSRKEFFETGKTFKNTVTLDGGTAKTSVRFSVTNVNNSWIVPNTGYKRNTVSLSASQKATDKLQISTKINYTNKWSDNLPASGYNNQTIMYWNMFWVPNGNLAWLKDYWMPGKEGVEQSYPFSSSPDNPYLMAYEMLNKLNRNAVTGNIQASYEFTKNLSLQVRTSMDLSHDQRSEQRPMDTQKFSLGMYRSWNIFSQEMNSDFLLRFNKKINSKFEMSLSAGGSMLKNRYMKDELRANSLQYPQIFSLANSKDIISVFPYRSEYAINSLYGLGTVSYNNYLFLDVTARNDWNSVLATPASTANVSFFYPSVNLAAVISDMVKLPAAVSFAKLRASYAGVGSGGTRTYQNTYTYQTVANFSGGLQDPATLPNQNLKPQYTTSYELGADVRLFRSRLGLDITVYKGDTKDQILTANLDRASGYNNIVVNGGLVRNQGIEIEVNGKPFKSKKGLNWTITGTFSANQNTVVRLTDSLYALQFQSTLSGRAFLEARVGASVGSIYGAGYQRAPDGQIIYENGYPLLTEDRLNLGNPTPKWRASLGNQLKYKQFRFNMLIDGQYGGKGYSLTHALLAEHGKTKNTLPGRYNGVIGKGVIKNPDGTYRPNDVVAEDIWTFYLRTYGRDNVEGSVFSTDFIKLREVRLDYELPSKLNKRLGLQKATVGIYGRDLFMITSWPAFDPEFGTLNNGSIDKGFELGQFPSTRTFGLNLIIGI